MLCAKLGLLAVRARSLARTRAVCYSKPWLTNDIAGNARLSSWALASLATKKPEHGLASVELTGQRMAQHRARDCGMFDLVGGTVGVRHGSARAGKANGSRTEKPRIPSFIEIRELAGLLRVTPKALFKALGGYQEKKMHRAVLSGVPYAFPKLGSVIVPFQDTQAVTKVLGADIRFLDVEKRPARAALGVSPRPEAFRWEEGENGHGRRPVVVLLGHFNHGKTTILDALLGPNSAIARREAGGITQEIRARTVSLELNQKDKADSGDAMGIATPISSGSGLATVATFLDTPGQEIFYRMRTNGARVADAVLLVVSAVDGICLQTSESIGCAEELQLPAVVALNKMDLVPDAEAAQRLEDLSRQVREYVAIEDAQVLPISAHTGIGLDSIRTALASALGRHPSFAIEAPPAARDASPLPSGPPELKERCLSGASGSDKTPAVKVGLENVGSETLDAAESDCGVSMADAPEGAATATVLDYTSSAKTGKLLLVLVDRGVLRPGDYFVSGLLWGFVRSIYDEEGATLLKHAGPGVAAKVVVVAKTGVSDAPLGEPFRVLTKQSAEQVARVRVLARRIDNFVDHRKLARDFQHLLEEDPTDENDGQNETDVFDADGNVTDENRVESREPPAKKRALERPKRLSKDDDDMAPENMPVTVVVKADTANTLASIQDALGDWGDVERFQENVEGQSEGNPGGGSHEGVAGQRTRDQEQTRQWGEADLQHKQRRRLVISLAHSGVGSVTSSDVRLARDCECPVFAHNVRADASAAKELKRVGGVVVAARSEEEAGEDFEWDDRRIGRAGQGRECIVVSDTVGELLGEIERFVLRVR